LPIANQSKSHWFFIFPMRWRRIGDHAPNPKKKRWCFQLFGWRNVSYFFPNPTELKSKTSTKNNVMSDYQNHNSENQNNQKPIQKTFT
jgi:hypothetical protein